MKIHPINLTRAVAHLPVFPDKVLSYIKPKKCKVIVDMTFGTGGHARKLLEESKDIKLFCLDRDPIAHQFAIELKDEYPDQVIPLLGKFSDLPTLLKKHGFRQNSIDAILFDFGCSSIQTNVQNRGFSLNKDGPLDMRMDGENAPVPTAADVLNVINETELGKIFKVYGREKNHRKIAAAILEARYAHKSIQTTNELCYLVRSAVGPIPSRDENGRYTDPAANIFRALRIFVNNELNEINYAMILARNYLKIGGVAVTLSFNILEDTIVKRHISGHVSEGLANELPLRFYSSMTLHSDESISAYTCTFWKSLTKHVIVPNEHEIYDNPKCKSAKLRAFVRTS